MSPARFTSGVDCWALIGIVRTSVARGLLIIPTLIILVCRTVHAWMLMLAAAKLCLFISACFQWCALLARHAMVAWTFSYPFCLLYAQDVRTHQQIKPDTYIQFGVWHSRQIMSHLYTCSNRQPGPLVTHVNGFTPDATPVLTLLWECCCSYQLTSSIGHISSSTS